MCALLTSCATEVPSAKAPSDASAASANMTPSGLPEEDPPRRLEVGSALCEEEVLRAGSLDGDAPLTERDSANDYRYDTFTIRACSGAYALVEASKSSSSSFDYWLMIADSQRWEIVEVAGVRIDTPVQEGLFDCGTLKSSGVPIDSVLDTLGAQVSGVGRGLCR